MTEREALKLSREALRTVHYAMIDAGVLNRQEVLNKVLTAIAAIEEALAQPEQGPLRWKVTSGGAYEAESYLVAERVDGKGWNAHKGSKNLLLAESLKRCKEVCELDARLQPEQEPVIGTKTWFEDGKVVTQHLTAKDIYKDPEQPEHEPVERGGLRFYTNGIERQHWKADGSIDFKDEKGNVTMTLASGEIKAPIHFCAPPQRTWVGLTPDEIEEIAEFHGLNCMSYEPFTKAIEAKLKEKNT